MRDDDLLGPDQEQMVMDEFMHECGGPDCPVCLGDQELLVAPDILNYKRVPGEVNKYRKEETGEEITFKEGARHQLTAPCPLCYPSLYPHFYTVN